MSTDIALDDPTRCREMVRTENGKERCILPRHGGIFQHTTVHPISSPEALRARDAYVWDAAADCLTDLTQRSVLRGLNPYRDTMTIDDALSA